MFCNCPVCEGVRALGQAEFRTRTQVLIDGKLSVDFPPDAYFHSLKYGFNCADIRYLLVTHSHMDHFYAHDFILRGYRYGSGFDGRLEIYGNAEVCAVFSECTRREMKPSVAPNVAMNGIAARRPRLHLRRPHGNAPPQAYEHRGRNDCSLKAESRGRVRRQYKVRNHTLFSQQQPAPFPPRGGGSGVRCHRRLRRLYRGDLKKCT